MRCKEGVLLSLRVKTSQLSLDDLEVQESVEQRANSEHLVG